MPSSEIERELAAKVPSGSCAFSVAVAWSPLFLPFRSAQVVDPSKKTLRRKPLRRDLQRSADNPVSISASPPSCMGKTPQSPADGEAAGAAQAGDASGAELRAGVVIRVHRAHALVDAAGRLEARAEGHAIPGLLGLRGARGRSLLGAAVAGGLPLLLHVLAHRAALASGLAGCRLHLPRRSFKEDPSVLGSVDSVLARTRWYSGCCRPW